MPLTTAQVENPSHPRNPMYQNVLLVGATGNLGRRIAARLLDNEKVSLRLLMRPGASDNPAKVTSSPA